MSNILAALAAIDATRLSYQEWINIGMALRQEGYDCSVWDDWSRTDPSRYHAGECERKWRSFNGSPSPVTGATVVQIAKDQGWNSAEGGIMGWFDIISDDGDAPEPWDASADLITYLETLFEPADYVGYVTNEAFQADDGRWVPSKGIYRRTAESIISALKQHPHDIGAVLGDWKPEAGAWIRFNPLDGKGVKNENVIRFHYALVECDTLSVQEQEAAYRKLELPIACMVHSGGKSIHAIVRVDAEDYDEYRSRVDFLYGFLEQNGIPVDKQNRNPSRLSRMPGATRKGVPQKLIAVNIGKKTWADWVEFVDGENDSLPEIVSLSDFQEPPALPEELIKGVLRCGHKMLISGSSKAGKSFLLMELCICLAEGIKWLNFPCKQSRVLYVNLEIDPASCLHRFFKIYEAYGRKMTHANNISIWNLRGHAVPLDKLVPKLLRRMRNQHYDAVILDPIYKIITGDENNASDMGAFCNQFDKICSEIGCAAIYCHHHSKGAQGSKKAMDRASGSGVFARDPDAQLDIIQLDLDDDLKNNVRDGNATAWRLESSLREFQNFEPVNFWFEYPIHRVDTSGELRKAAAEGSPEANLAKSSKRTTEDRRGSLLDSAFDVCVQNGTALVKDMAKYAGVSDHTIRRYIAEFKDEYHLDKGTVTRVAPT